MQESKIVFRAIRESEIRDYIRRYDVVRFAGAFDENHPLRRSCFRELQLCDRSCAGPPGRDAAGAGNRNLSTSNSAIPAKNATVALDRLRT